MKQVTFITSNQNKADYLAKLIGFSIPHRKVELEEIQSTDLKTVVAHKIRQAYQIVQGPVLIEDVSLEFSALNGLPGTFIKFFVEQTGLENTCRMLDAYSDRSATAKCMYAYFDGTDIQYFEGSLQGEISEKPRGNGGYGWDKIFIPNGYRGFTKAELSVAQNEEVYLKIKPIQKVSDFLG